MQPQTPTPVLPVSKQSRAGLWIGVLSILLIAALVFSIWAYQGKQSSKNNQGKNIASAVAAAKSQQQAADQAGFDTKLNQPSKTFTGSATYGSIKFSYPKTYSAYVDTSNSNEPINGYFHPGEVPGINSNVNYALRIELVASTYSSVVQQYQSQVQSGDLTSSVFVPAKLAKSANLQRGVKLTGKFGDTQSGAMVIIPVRDQTLKLYTMSNDFLGDFNSVVLPSLTFNP